ncbi:UNVERIFIED_CONTAM: putative enzymatic polyprotein [Sesamum calycinum]|uniref:Enzymatic polyprotein n=1 Tax=Sesamum calycinum TaxID=2727403 RepID=A0AAW2NW29_9LAMI
MNMEDKKDMQMIIKEHINLGLIEPGISAYSSPGFLIKMESESKKFTAFSTPQGQYIWNVTMGLANAPQIFQRKMDNLFKDYFEFMFVYIDDILIASKNMKEHIKHLEIFSDACHKEGLVLSEKKATIAVNKIEFLGILIDEAGIELQEHIVEKIRNFPDVLKDKKQLQSFLGVVNFAGIFIKDLAKYRKDFRPLLKETESAKWKWEEIHTQRVRELKQVCNNLPKLAIPQDEDELVVYTDANDYRWAAVLMKKTTTGEEPCRYTGGLFTEQQAQVWHINEKEFFAVWKAFKKWPLFLLAKEFTLKVDNTNVKAFLKNKLESKIEKARLSTDVGKISFSQRRKSKQNDHRNIRKYNRVWMLEGPNLKMSRNGMSSGSSSVHTMSPFRKYQNFRNGLVGRSMIRGKITPLKKRRYFGVKIYLSSSRNAGKGSHPAFHFIKLQRPDMVAFNRIKATTGEAPLVSAISEDDISTRRAWGLWVCLTEMDKVKYPFKIFSNKVNGSFLLNSMTGKSTEFAESMFEKKRMLIWENKLPATESTRMKACNMLHVGQWHNHVCPCCEKQEKPMFGTKIRVTQKKPEPNPDKAGKDDDGSNDVIQMTNAMTSSKRVKVRI